MSRSQYSTSLSPHLPALTFLLMLPEPGGGGNKDVPFMARHSTAVYFLHFDQLWVSAVTANHCKQKLVCPELTAGFKFFSKVKMLLAVSVGGRDLRNDREA